DLLPGEVRSVRGDDDVLVGKLTMDDVVRGGTGHDHDDSGRDADDRDDPRHASHELLLVQVSRTATVLPIVSRFAIASISAGMSAKSMTRPTTARTFSARTSSTISCMMRSPSVAGTKFHPIAVFRNSETSGAA